MPRLTTQTNSDGFTIIELMIVIGVVAILTLLAVPAYRDYAIRSKVSECINAAAVAKLHISEYRQIMGPWPPSLEDAGLAGQTGSSQYCTGFIGYSPSDGSFMIDVDVTAVGVESGLLRPRLTPLPTVAGIINWDCSLGGSSPSNIKFLPASCRDS